MTSSPALGIAYSLWLRLRWIVGATLISYLVLAVVPQFVPMAAPYCCGVSIAILFLAMVPLLNTFSFGPADLGVKSSGFPPHMRTLPISTRAIVGWPMLFAAATFALLWMLPACLIFMPAGFAVPIFWPAALFAAICFWIQAIGWSPFPSPFARVPALLIAVAPLTVPLAFGITFLEGNTFSAILFACGIIWSVAAYAFGVQGLSRARTGSEGDWFGPIAERWAERARHRHAAGYCRRRFGSPFAAQLWHECRRNAPFLPVLTGFVGLPMLLVLCLPLLRERPNEPLLFGSTTISPQLMMLAMWAGLPIGFAITQGAGMAKFDIWGKIPMTAFFATRPLKTSQFILTKFCSTAISVIATWVVTIALFSLWAILETSSLNSHPSIVRATLAEATPRTTATFLAALLGLIALTWRNMVSGMWPTLLGRRQLSVAIGFAFLAAYILLGIIGAWIYTYPSFHGLFWTVLPWIVVCLIGLKLGVSFYLGWTLQQRGLMSTKMMKLAAIGWVLLAGCLIGGACFVVSPTWTLAAIVVMSLPFPSVAAMPLALDWNRHR
jgi:hypothetical protein